MCGLIAVFSPEQSVPTAALGPMLSSLAHRGPDDEGLVLGGPSGVHTWGGPDTAPESWTTPTPWQPKGSWSRERPPPAQWALGHRRLAIVDLSPLGHQPMAYAPGGQAAQWIVFNGEIYNHVELRAELEALGCSFRSNSDTEVVLAAVKHWGLAALNRFNGMWAFCLVDLAKQEVLVARDRFGVKPLFWWRAPDGTLVFASELKAFLRFPGFQFQPDLAACDALIHSGGQAWGQETLWQGTQRFPAGHHWTLGLDGRSRGAPAPFWRYPDQDPSLATQPFVAKAADEWANEYRHLLQDAVRVRMRMDVRFGTALSGGLDSSQIAWLVNQELKSRGRGEQQEVFSSVYAAKQATRTELAADESSHVDAVAGHLGVVGRRIRPLWSEIPDAHSHMIWALDEPPANTLMSSWHTYRLVAAHGVIVTLDGQGADEQLGGYLHYVRQHLAHMPLPQALREASAFRQRIAGIGRTPWVGCLGSAAKLVSGSAGLHAIRRLVPRLGEWERPAHEAMAQEFRTTLQTLLHYADHTSMAWSLESRMPFMDYRLVERLAQMPMAYRMHDGWTKWLPRHAMQGELPSSVVWRRDKMGWAIPEHAWFGEDAPLATWLDAQISASRFAKDCAARVGINWRTAALSKRIRLLNLAVWHRQLADESRPEGVTLGKKMLARLAA